MLPLALVSGRALDEVLSMARTIGEAGGFMVTVGVEQFCLLLTMHVLSAVVTGTGLPVDCSDRLATGVSRAEGVVEVGMTVVDV